MVLTPFAILPPALAEAPMNPPTGPGKVSMMIDAHCHIFTTKIVKNMQSRPDLLDRLHLNVWDAEERLEPKDLQESAENNNVASCLLLPSTGPKKIRDENDRFIGLTKIFPRLRTLATLHPMMSDSAAEIVRMLDAGITGFKFSSFSQRFDVSSPQMEILLTEMERAAQERSMKIAAVFDTFVQAQTYLGADSNHLTTPLRLSQLVERHPAINFVGAHMGGLLADFDELRRDLPPATNLYLDTSNAAHTLEEEQFVELLRIHGSSRILFGTDWPWFLHRHESAFVERLLKKAGYDESECSAVFEGNARKVYAL